ncbi:hypothetical protein [Paenibacillus sp. Soil522]|uniref:hypothetical protein n=1 Tax=Paenibacillus sp. Soil522 TaxID=1736388 RepID=UPI0006FEF155|nr:hypothetical protein [Paenibacillus sp. Soil522]KRE44893.1 hypothetical protein ASG81_14485 [Paenibacillus sp. Soil522]
MQANFETVTPNIKQVSWKMKKNATFALEMRKVKKYHALVLMALPGLEFMHHLFSGNHRYRQRVL